MKLNVSSYSKFNFFGQCLKNGSFNEAAKGESTSPKPPSYNLLANSPSVTTLASQPPAFKSPSVYHYHITQPYNNVCRLAIIIPKIIIQISETEEED